MAGGRGGKAMGQTKLVQLEIAESEEAFVRTLAGKLGWKVITGGEGEHSQEGEAGESSERTAEASGFAGGNEGDGEDLSRYSPVIQELRRRLHTKITADDIASDARLVYCITDN